MSADQKRESQAHGGRNNAGRIARATRLTRLSRGIESAVKTAINSGFVIGREVFVGPLPGIVVAYNITAFGRFTGNEYPLVIRTAQGIATCRTDEVELT